MLVFEPKIVERIGDGIARVQVGTFIRMWVTAVMRKQKHCALCNHVINRGDRSWRELTQLSSYKLKRVCTRCWPREVEKAMAMSADLRRKKPANRWGCKPNEDVCVEHDEPLCCKHGCGHAKQHECRETEIKMLAQTDPHPPTSNAPPAE